MPAYLGPRVLAMLLVTVLVAIWYQPIAVHLSNIGFLRDIMPWFLFVHYDYTLASFLGLIIIVTIGAIWNRQCKIKHLQYEIQDTNVELFTYETSEVTQHKQYLQRALITSATRAAYALSGSQDRLAEVRKLEESARDILDKDSPTNIELGEAQYWITSIDDLVLLEDSLTRNERYSRYAALVIMVVFLVLIGWTVMSVYSGSLTVETVPPFKIPFYVVMWGALGSLAAILYRFYREKSSVLFSVELHWLIARPIIGIIMSAVVYLAIVSGLIFLGSNLPTEPSEAQYAAFSICAFLAGFSDGFYENIIDRLVKNVSPAESNEPSTLPSSGNLESAESTDVLPANLVEKA